MSKLYALLDCNNFFASCERVFNPSLRHKPVVVLSNNDGCVIARSNEAKAVGIAMGEPVFKCRDKIAAHKVAVYSANFVLYGDLSARVMHTAAGFTHDIEIYSIDEAFLHMDDVGGPYDYGLMVRETVRRNTGMPVSIGIATTKTLAKVANRIAKKQSIDGVFCLEEPAIIEHWLKKTVVEDVWGIGRNKSEFLKRHGIENAYQLTCMPDAWIKKNLTVISLKTVWELRGIPCFESQDNDLDKQSIGTSRTFGHEVASLEALEESVCAYTANAAEKLRQQHSVCGYLQVFVSTNRFKDRYYANAAGIDITPPTAYTPDLMAVAKKILARLYRPGFSYKQCGVVLANIQSQSSTQGFLFDQTYHDSPKQRLMNVIDGHNHRTNSGKIFIAAEGTGPRWQSQSLRSKRFTTRWDEILEIKI